ncbi:hypothetical protein ACKWTF_015488 [Chironomus riparius]
MINLHLRRAFIIIINFLYFFDAAEPIDIKCDYKMGFSAIFKSLYECNVQNNLNITSEQSAMIGFASDNHTLGKTHNDVNIFKAYNKNIQYFPKGLEKIFPNLLRIHIERGYLEDLNSEDLRPYPKLVELYLWGNNIQVLENGLFAYNTNLQHVSFSHNSIIHIDENVFDDLTKLTYLWLYGSNCFNAGTSNSSIDVKNIIQSLRVKCNSPEFVALRIEYQQLEQDVKSSGHKINKAVPKMIQNFEQKLNPEFRTIFERKLALLTNSSNQTHKTVENESEKLQMESDSTSLMIEISRLQEIVKSQNEKIANYIEQKDKCNIIMIILIGISEISQLIMLIIGCYYVFYCEEK